MELNSNEVAALLGVAESKVREWAYSGKLPIVDVQGRLRFNRQAILEWALTHGHPLNFGMASTEPPGLPPLTELFEPERFHYDLPGRTFAEVLRAALDVFVLPSEDRELIGAHAVSTAQSRAQAAPGAARAVVIFVSPARVRHAVARASETRNDPRMGSARRT